MTLQLYAYGGRFCARSTIFIGSIIIAILGATIAVFSGTLWALWSVIVSLIGVAFYFSYLGTDRALVGIWSAVLIMTNAFFPITWSQWTVRITPLLIGVLVAYVMLLVKIPRRNKDKIIPQLQSILISFQSYMEYVFHHILFENRASKNRDRYDEAREALSQLRCLSDRLGCTYSINHSATKKMLENFYDSYAQIFYWLLTLEHTKKHVFLTETKLTLEELHISFQSLQKSFLEISDQNKTLKSVHYLLNKIKNVAHIETAPLIYALSKLADELECFALFLTSSAVKESIIYLQQSRL
ncbi:MAG: hypothetical protein V4496_00110 [Pseudomonadota bacterium]